MSRIKGSRNIASSHRNTGNKGNSPARSRSGRNAANKAHAMNIGSKRGKYVK